MAQSKSSSVAILAVAIIFGVAALRTTHAFVIHVDRTKAAAAAAAAASIKCAPLRATESFQRSLLESQFLDSVPDTAPKILDGVVVTKTNNAEAYNDNNNLAIQNSILRIAASTDRGQNANSGQRERISRSIASLVHERRIQITTVDDDEEGTDMIIPSYLSGTWELLYSNAQLFRSSPFFMAGRFDVYHAGAGGTVRLVLRYASCGIGRIYNWDRPTDYYQWWTTGE
jgi:hypothetical protein